MIEIKDLTKRFDGFTALQELNMTVPQASVYGLVGPNGAGKSTIIRHLTGVYQPDSGEVLVGGAPGIGKSTLLLQICAYLGRTQKILYVSGEESEQQLKMRADRLRVESDNLYVLSETDLDAILEAFEAALKKTDLSGKNQLILLGDYIDYGPDGRAVLEKVRALQEKYGSEKVIALMGNHEKALLDWLEEYADVNRHIGSVEQYLSLIHI